MKRIIIFAALLFAALLSFSGCKCKDGEHDYKETVITEATCTKEGVSEYVCTVCGDSYREAIKASGHDYESKETRTPDCTKKGEITYTCKVCGDSYKEETETDPEKHDPDGGNVTLEATCTTDGTLTYTCKRCGKIETQTIPATGHDYYSTLSAATCTEDGAEVFTCRGCGDTYSNALPATGHNFEEATCTTPKRCVNCGLTEGSFLGHTVYGGVCARCGKSTDTTEILSISGVGIPLYDAKGGYAVITNAVMDYEYIYQRGFSGTANVSLTLDSTNAKDDFIPVAAYLKDEATGVERKAYVTTVFPKTGGGGTMYVGYDLFGFTEPGLYSLRFASEN